MPPFKYKESGTPLVALAGKQYGTGSSRDWAAKGTNLLGVKCVIAVSYERIHRSNLIQMGVLPLQFKEGESADILGLDGSETFDIHVDNDVKARGEIKVVASKADGSTTEFMTQCRIDTPVEVDYYRNGGILHTVLLDYLKKVNIKFYILAEFSGDVLFYLYEQTSSLLWLNYKSQQMAENFKHMQLLLHAIEGINRTMELKSLLLKCMNSASQLMDAEASSLMLLDKISGDLHVSIPTGLIKDKITGMNIPKDKGVAGWVNLSIKTIPI